MVAMIVPMRISEAAEIEGTDQARHGVSSRDCE
jgi:hypothetical protein